MRTLIISIPSLLPTLAFAAAFNIAYVEVNNHQLANAGCFVNTENGKPFFDMVGIFAANINGADPNAPRVYFNPQVDAILNKSSQVGQLQAQGIKVLLTLLGNHENSGWACMTNEKAIQTFANEVVDVVQKYHLDGVDIDDEYSNCAPNNTSMIRIAQAIKNHPKFKNKVLTKALYADHWFFAADYQGMKLADFLDYGWEMTYGGDASYRLPPYVKFGMQPAKLALGITAQQSTQAAKAAANYIQANHFGGVMVYNVDRNALGILNELSQAENKGEVKTLPGCLK